MRSLSVNNEVVTRVCQYRGTIPAETHLIAYGPEGGGAVFFREANGSAPTPEIVDLPRGFAFATVAHDLPLILDNKLTFTGLSRNGSFESATIDLDPSPPSVSRDSIATVLVTRESAQSVFGELTSLPVMVALGVFALMAGAFGPAALAGLTDVAQEDKRGTTMGLYSVVISSSMIVGPITTGYLVDNYGGFGVMVFLASSATAMAIFMAMRALDVRRAGGERALHAKATGRRETSEGEEEPPGASDGPPPEKED